MYSHKINRKYIKACSTIYILDDGITNLINPDPSSNAFESAKKIDEDLIKAKNATNLSL